jgi:hypothetical protein
METPWAVADAQESPPMARAAQSPIGTKGLAETIRALKSGALMLMEIEARSPSRFRAGL